MDKPAQRYLKRLSRGLICSREDRERLLRDARAMLENFSQENPGAFYGDYAASFGPPEEFAAQMLSNLDPEDVSEARLRRKRALMGTGVAAAVLVILALGFWFGQRSRTPAEVLTPSAELTAPVSTPEGTPAPAPAESPEISRRKEGEAEAFAEAFLEGQFEDGDRIVYKRAVATMLRLNVMVAGEEFRPQEPVTRGLAAKYMALMLAGGDGLYWPGEDYELSAGFSDTQGHWSESYVEYCVDAGVISGGGDGCFDPDAHITGLEFAKLALAALGYEPTAYQLTGPLWDSMTNRLALQVCNPSLYDGLDNVALSDPISREQAAQMMYNMLDNATIWAYPHNSEVLGETTYQYEHKNDENGQPLTFFDVHFTDWDREDVF